MTADQTEHKLRIKVEDDDIWEEDKDFYVLICDEEGNQLDGVDTKTKVTILDEDSPGVLSFEQTKIKMRKQDQTTFVRVLRENGADGEAKCTYRITEMEDAPYKAKEHEDFEPDTGEVIFEKNQTEQMIEVKLFQTADVPDQSDKSRDEEADGGDGSEEEAVPKVFKIVIENAVPSGVKISRNSTCVVTIVPDDDLEADELLA